VMVSFGGAANTPLAAACNDVPSLVTAYTDTIMSLGLVRIDFDVEGFWVADHGVGGSVTRRSLAITQLQVDFAAAGRPLEVWYTLPVLPSGLTADGIAVLDDGLTNGVEIDGVNVMTMDYGGGAAPNPQDMMGEYGIQAIQSLHAQLDTLYTQHGTPKTSAELWAMIGTTPMIGMNDVVSELFHLQDAQETLDFANQEQIGMISMWSLNRDHSCPNATWVQLDCSSIPDQTADWEFTAIFEPYTSP
jgi:chitinase